MKAVVRDLFFIRHHIDRFQVRPAITWHGGDGAWDAMELYHLALSSIDRAGYDVTREPWRSAVVLHQEYSLEMAERVLARVVEILEKDTPAPVVDAMYGLLLAQRRDEAEAEAAARSALDPSPGARA